MKFYCFPKKKEIFVVCSSFRTFHSKLFENLITQISAKNSQYFRFLKTNLGFLILSLSGLKIEVPNKDAEFVGIVKRGNYILFEMKNNIPIQVWRKNSNKLWINEPFIGYQLISRYTVKEFNSKYGLIETSLKKHWDSLTNNKSFKVHGDLTHFNILYDNSNNIYYIDSKKHENSKLFDFFYFYTYLKQCFTKTSTLTEKEKDEILKNINSILTKTCVYSSKNSFDSDFNQIKMPYYHGLSKKNLKKYLDDFHKLFEFI